MRKIQNHDLAQLLLQLRFTPEKKRRPQLKAAQELLEAIDAETVYPFDFVFYRITGFYPKSPLHSEPTRGAELAEDLRIFISKLSGQLAERVSEQDERVYGIEELTQVFGVSTKTVHRWRKRGLMALKFIFDDGHKRFGFLQSSVDKFVEANGELVSSAKGFNRLDDEQKKKITRQAASLASKTDMSRHQIIEKIAAETGRAHETIRYTLLEFEKQNGNSAGGKALAKLSRGAISSAEAGELYKLHKQGVGVKELMERFGRSKSSIYRIINQRRAKMLLAHKIEFIASDEFVREGASEVILGDGQTSAGAEPVDGAGEEAGYFQGLKGASALTREREVELFRKYNYLKFLAHERRGRINMSRVYSADLDEMEEYLSQAEAIKKMIIEANLRLVATVARRHTVGGGNLPDLISEGNFSLLRAVEKFDYRRGFRFGTYASWAIAKDFARKIPAEKSRPDKATAGSMDEIQQNFRIAKMADFAAIEDARKSLVQVIRDELDEREQYVILNHFGLIGSLVKKKKRTLKQIGEHLGLTKERVRQIELEALQKLRQSLSIEEFELLTG
jgi:RNA polymerase primary sigma factor